MRNLLLLSFAWCQQHMMMSSHAAHFEMAPGLTAWCTNKKTHLSLLLILQLTRLMWQNQQFKVEITRMTPRLQRSQALSYPALSKSSGAAYCSVKQGVCRGALPAGHRRANPKSITFSMESSPSSANSTFCKVNKEKASSFSCIFPTFIHSRIVVFSKKH